MKRLLLVALILSAFSVNAQTGYPTLRNNGTIGAQEEYLINSPGNTPGNSVVTKRTKDSTYFELLLKNLYLRNLPNTVNNGNPVNFLHTDADGRVLSSSLSWLFADTLNTFVTKSYLSINTYTKAQSDMRYLQSYAPDSQSVVNAVGFPTWQSLLNKLSVETDPLFNTKFATKSTTDLVEGVNLYYTPTRFINAFNAALTPGAINIALGYIAYNGSTNPSNFLTSASLAGYWLKNDTLANNYTTQYRLDTVKSNLNTSIATKVSSSALTIALLAYLQKSDSNIYVPKYRLDSAVNSFYAIAALKLNISSFTTTVINALYGGTLALKTDTTALNLVTRFASKEPTITAGTNLQFWRGDKTWTDFNTTARAALSQGTGINYNSATGVISSTSVAPTFNNAPTITLNTSKQISTTNNTRVSYTVLSSVQLTLLVGAGTVQTLLEISPNNSTWTTINSVGLSESLTVAISGTKSQYQNIQGEVPSGYWVRLRTVITQTGLQAGTTITYSSGQEVVY